MKRLKFTKMAGAGNDFVVMDNRSKILAKNLPAYAKRLLDRKRAIGADGLILLEKSKKADLRMRIFNPDGSEAEMCGNGVRCLAKFAVDKKIAAARHRVETKAGLISAEVRGCTVKARMMAPKGLRLNFALLVQGENRTLNFIDTGVPHVVLVEHSLKGCDVSGTGRELRFHKHFAPKGTNVDFISIRNDNSIEIRTYERGVEDETLSCGTGSTAGALVAASLKNLKSPVRVRTASGEGLKVYFTKNGAGFHDVYLKGPVKTIFEGGINI